MGAIIFLGVAAVFMGLVFIGWRDVMKSRGRSSAGQSASLIRKRP